MIMMELCDRNNCTGCGACYNVCPREAITMEADSEGFLRPVIHADRCIECGLCRKVCPELFPMEKHPQVEQPIAAVSKCEEILRGSSSGGLFSHLAGAILADKGVVYGAVMDDNRVYHRAVNDRLELVSLRGSKYMQSDTADTFRKVRVDLEAGRPVLYSGTPCQIAGLRRYLEVRKVNTERFYSVDIVCHGTPSAKMFQTYLAKLAAYKKLPVDEIREFRFRQLAEWGITPSFLYKGERTLLTEKENLYMKLFLSARLHRPCCYVCRYAVQVRVSDITLADFWGISSSFLYDTSHGCSLVLPNTPKGKNLFERVACDLNYEQREWEEALKVNHQLYRPSIFPPDREAAIASLLEEPYLKTYTRYFNTPWMRMKRYVRRVLSFIKRTLKSL